jgi:hypothetical protein
MASQACCQHRACEPCSASTRHSGVNETLGAVDIISASDVHVRLMFGMCRTSLRSCLAVDLPASPNPLHWALHAMFAATLRFVLPLTMHAFSRHHAGGALARGEEYHGIRALMHSRQRAGSRGLPLPQRVRSPTRQILPLSTVNTLRQLALCLCAFDNCAFGKLFRSCLFDQHAALALATSS